MLPLWIIDITNQSERQGAFKRLVGRIGHVYMADPLHVNTQPSSQPDASAATDEERAAENDAVRVSFFEPGTDEFDAFLVFFLIISHSFAPLCLILLRSGAEHKPGNVIYMKKNLQRFMQIWYIYCVIIFP